MAKRIKHTQTSVPRKTRKFPSILAEKFDLDSSNGWKIVKKVPMTAIPSPKSSFLVTHSLRKTTPPMAMKIGAVMEIKEASIALVLLIPRKSSKRFKGVQRNPKKRYESQSFLVGLIFLILKIVGIATISEAIRNR